MKTLEQITEELKGGFMINSHTTDCWVQKHDETRQILIGKRAPTCTEAANMVYAEYRNQVEEL